MSENLRKQYPKLELLSKVKCQKARLVIVREFSEDPDFCKAMREIVKNTVNRNIKLHEVDKTKLRKMRVMLLGLLKKKKGKKRTKALVQQAGSGIFLPIILPYVASAIYDLLQPK